MSEETKKAPAIRFQGFTDDWEQRKLIEEADFFDEKRIPIDSEKRVQGRYPYYGATGVIDYVDNYIFDGEYILLAEDGANIITRNSPVAYITEGKFWLNNHAHIMKMKLGSNLFLLQLLERQNYEKFNSGTAQPKLNGQIVKNMIFNFPSYKEQNKIGNFFKLIDEAIALHQRQLDNYKQLKKSMKQKIFDQKLRFKDADGNDYPKWKRRTLGEISEIIMGQSPDSANYTSNEQDTVLIQGNADLNGGRITPRIYTTQITKTCEAGDIILTVRAPVGDLAIANTRACIGRGVCAIKGDLYIYQYLEMIRDTDGWRKIIQGSTFESINSNDVKDLPIDVPSSEERKKIAEFFKALDRRIEKSTQRVESMKQFRKGLMQQMFVE